MSYPLTKEVLEEQAQKIRAAGLCARLLRDGKEQHDRMTEAELELVRAVWQEVVEILKEEARR